jgi:hypothetical protein
MIDTYLTSRPIIEFRIVAKDPFLIEGQAPFGGEICNESVD